MKKFFLLLLCLLPVFSICQADTRDAQLTDLQFVSGRVLRDIAPHTFDNSSALYQDDRVTVLGYKTAPQGNPTEYFVDTGKACFFLPAAYIQLYTPDSFEVGQTGIINTNKVNVRRGAGTSNPRAYYADKWDKVYIREIKTLENGETWLRVSGEDAHSRMDNAWVRCEYVFVDEPANTPLPEKNMLVEETFLPTGSYYEREPVDVWYLSEREVIFAQYNKKCKVRAVSYDLVTRSIRRVYEFADHPGICPLISNITRVGDTLLFSFIDHEADIAFSVASFPDDAARPAYRVFDSDWIVFHCETSSQGIFLMDASAASVRIAFVNPDLSLRFDKNLTEIDITGYGTVSLADNAPSISASPYIALENRLYIAFDLWKEQIKALCCFDMEGNLLWNTYFPYDMKLSPCNISCDDNFLLSVYTQEGKNSVLCYSDTGELLWSKDIAQALDWRFYIAQGQFIYALAPENAGSKQSTLYCMTPEMEILHSFFFTHPQDYIYKKLGVDCNGNIFLVCLYRDPMVDTYDRPACIYINAHCFDGGNF